MGSRRPGTSQQKWQIDPCKTLLSKLPSVPDLQIAWLLLLMCAAHRGSPLPLFIVLFLFLIRALPPAYTAGFAHKHDEAVIACLQELLANGGPPLWEANATRQAQLPLQLGGLGFRSAETTRFAAHWASWADTVPTGTQALWRSCSARLRPGG